MAAMQGIAVTREAAAAGRIVPRDLSVVGFNDIPEAATSVPPPTPVDGATEERGRIAARLLLEHGPVGHEILPTRLPVRGSTAPPRP